MKIEIIDEVPPTTRGDRSLWQEVWEAFDHSVAPLRIVCDDAREARRLRGAANNAKKTRPSLNFRLEGDVVYLWHGEVDGRKMATEAGLDEDIAKGYEQAQRLLDPVLGGALPHESTWDPATQAWRAAG